MKKIVKCGGHCYDGCGWTACDFYETVKRNEEREPRCFCTLFGQSDGVEKYASESLKICNQIYGMDYNGAP